MTNPTWFLQDASSNMCAGALPPDSSQLRVRPQASTGVRCVTLLKSQLLYQLSYAGAPVIVFAESPAACRRSHGHPPALLSKLLSNRKTARLHEPVHIRDAEVGVIRL